MACVLALILVTGAVAFWWVAARFDPIRLNSAGTSRVRVEGGQLTRVEGNEPTTGNPLTAFHVPYRDGKWLDMGFTIYNFSPFTITVEDVGYRDSGGDPLRQMSVLMESIDVPDLMVEMRRFTLAPDTGRYVVIRHRFSGCSMSKSREEYATYTRQRVIFTMRVGWVTIDRSEVLPLRYSVAVQGRGGCPNQVPAP
jgi:hypothetical protein